MHGKIERDGYTVEKVFFQRQPSGALRRGNLYRPTGVKGKRPVGRWEPATTSAVMLFASIAVSTTASGGLSIGVQLVSGSGHLRISHAAVAGRVR